MATQFIRTTTDVIPSQLKDEINNNVAFTATCTNITFDAPDQLTLDFNTDLSGGEVTMMDTLIAAHVPESIEVSGSQLPVSDVDSFKIAVHPSYKPKADKQNYAVWTGAGDDMASSPHEIGAGPMLIWNMEPQAGSPHPIQEISVDLEFSPENGRVWVHEGYLQFENGGHGDYMESFVMSKPSLIQPFANKILYVENNWIKYAVGSPNPATHGWADTPVLVPRSFSQDGDWDYDGVNLTPNLTGTGQYKISDIERRVHKYFNKIPCCGTSPYFSMTSDETTELPAGYFIRTTAYNVSNTTWCASIIIEIYRERTFIP